MLAKIMLTWFFLVLMTSGTHHQSTSSATTDDVKNIYAYIYDGYDKRIRPVWNQSHSLYVVVDFVISSLNEFDEKSQKLAVTGWIYTSWIDETLFWDPDDYGNISYVKVDRNSIWLPNIALKNTIGKLTLLPDLGGSALVHFDGTVIWIPGDSFVVSCEVDITFYPFDTQDCHFTFEMWDDTISEVALLSLEDSMDLSELQDNAEWTVIKAEIEDTGLHSKNLTAFVDHFMRLQRRPKFIVLTILVPIILLAILNICVFLIPLSSGERNSFCVTVYLSYAVFLGLITAELPHNSKNVSYLTMYLLALLVFSVVIVLITVIQVRLFIEYGETPAPASMIKLFACCARGNLSQVKPLTNDSADMKGKDMTTSNDEEIEQPKRNDNCVCLKDVLPRLDVPLFFFFLVIFCVMTSIFGILTYSHSS
ncbi:neuronal acetylcholine receptor subunit beta-3-like [Ylistrum balloti]|uniref:neuronal acetylcholine receptor subunit beta-3-like n=1 Tax=Ylistrum balloti TaxID=509963 RepID=UPI002905F06B|nr:neuronal acetylcholine receptor subunit beta-3-like [Ylistrum balloti]